MKRAEVLRILRERRGELAEFDRPMGLFGFIGLQLFLETLLGCKVDLGTPRSLKPRLKESVLQGAIHVA